MKVYGSFLVRCWLIQDRSQSERSIFDVEHIQTGNHLRAVTLREVEAWVIAACQSSKPVEESARLTQEESKPGKTVKDSGGKIYDS